MKRASSIAWLFSDSVDRVAFLFITAERRDREFVVRRCSRFRGERFNVLLGAPCVVCTRQNPGWSYAVEELGAMREMAGLKELWGLQDLASKTRRGRRRNRPDLAFSKAAPFGASEPGIASLYVSVKHDRKKDRAVVENRLGGFKNEACWHLKEDILFPEIEKFARASGADTSGTIFC